MRTNMCNIQMQHENQRKEIERMRRENRKLRKELDEAKIQIKALTHYIEHKESEDDSWDF